MSFRARAINNIVKGFRAGSRRAPSRFAINYARSYAAPITNVPAILFSTAAENKEEKQQLSPEEAKKMASEMLFNEKDVGEEKKDEKEEKVEFVPPTKEAGAAEEMADSGLGHGAGPGWTAGYARPDVRREAESPH